MKSARPDTHARAALVAPAILAGPLILFCDQWLKHWCDSHLQILSRKAILGQSFLVLSRVLNRGVAGDRFSTMPEGFIEPYTRYAPTAIWVALLAFVLSRFPAASFRERLGASLLVGSGASNLWDHWHSQFVTDTLQIYIGAGKYIPFNLADLGIVLGSLLITLEIAPRVLRDPLPRPSNAAQ